MLTDILMLGGGLICAYWALGAIVMILKALFGGREAKKEFNESKGIVLIGGFLAAVVALWLIPTSWESLFGGNDDTYEYAPYNPSFQGNSRTFVKTSYRCEDCSCDGYYGYKHQNGTYEGKCSNTDKWGHTCGHSPEDHGLRSW